MLPSLIMICTFMIIPLIRSFYLSFFKYDGLADPIFIGLDNFKRLINDSNFWNSLGNNLIFSTLVTALTVILGLLFAIAIDRRLKGWKVFKFSNFIPVMLSLTIVGLLFAKVLEPNFGLFNSMLGFLGLESFQMNWLGDPSLTLFSIIAVQVWQYSGFTMLLFLTAVEGISPEIHEAATLDGVTGWQRIIYIIIPMVKRIIFVVGMVQIIFSFKVFDIIWVMTEGGPGGASEVLGTYLYKNAFAWSQYGYASSIAVGMTITVCIFTVVYLKLTKLDKQEVE